MLKGMRGQDVAVLLGNGREGWFEKQKGLVVDEYVSAVGFGLGLLESFVEVRLHADRAKEQPEYAVAEKHRASGAWRTIDSPDAVILWKKHCVKVKPKYILRDVEVLYRRVPYWAVVRVHEGHGASRGLAVAELDVGGSVSLEVKDFQLVKGCEGAGLKRSFDGDVLGRLDGRHAP